MTVTHYPPGLTAGDVVRSERKRRGISPVSAAEHVGVAKSTLANVELNCKLASEAVLADLAKLCGLDAWELCLRDGRIPEAVAQWAKRDPSGAADRLRALIGGVP